MNDNIEDQKAKIRERYKGNTTDEVEVIPALPQPKLYGDDQIKRVAAYARVSTIDPNQTTSYELQKNYYTDFIKNHEGWIYVDIYADEGISGTSLNHRDKFKKMIEDCEAGKIDLIVTKSVSRFARNILDCIEYVRKLKALPNPVGIFFETENIYTLDSRSDMALAFLATMAQEESHVKSDIMNASYSMRFSKGILLTPALLGYDKDETTGKLVINEEEAKTVKLIFFLYMYGNTCTQIANLLTEYGRKTKKGNTKWSASSILQILQNERHCGDVLTRKTWTPNYLDHKAKKNRQNLEQRRWKNQHEAIIPRADFMAVQELIRNAKYGNKGFLPELKVINTGILNGFVSINPRWAAFKAADYIAASTSVGNSDNNLEERYKVTVKDGDFDLRNYQVARSQFFDKANIISITFSYKHIIFSSECIRKFKNQKYIEILINPVKNLLAIRKCNTSECRNAVRWSKIKSEQQYSRPIPGAAFIPTIYEIMKWNPNYKYRIRGNLSTKLDNMLITFDLLETEVFISQNNTEKDLDKNLLNKLKPFTSGPKKDILAFPENWANAFGENYYRQAQINELANWDKHNEWNITEEGIPYNTSEFEVTNHNDIYNHIKDLTNEIKQERLDNGE